MKNKKLFVCLMMVLALMFAMATGAAAAGSDTIYQNCTLYTSPGGGYAIRTLYAGEGVGVDEMRGNYTAVITYDQAGNHVDGWIPTSCLTNAGYSYRSYTPTYNTYYAPQAVPSGNAHTVLTATMHAGPNEATPVVGTVPINVPVTVVGNPGNGWLEIVYNGAYGYVGQAAVQYYAYY